MKKTTQLQSIKAIAEEFGWYDILQERNPYMVSFKHGENDMRVNFYFTTGTITIQDEGKDIETHKGPGTEKAAIRFFSRVMQDEE